MSSVSILSCYVEGFEIHMLHLLVLTVMHRSLHCFSNDGNKP